MTHPTQGGGYAELVEDLSQCAHWASKHDGMEHYRVTAEKAARRIKELEGENLSLRHQDADTAQALKQVHAQLVAIHGITGGNPDPSAAVGNVEAAIADLRAQLAEANAREERLTQERSDAMREAVNLARALWEQHYRDKAPHWKPLDYPAGVVSQIDNMVAGILEDFTASRSQVARLRAVIGAADYLISRLRNVIGRKVARDLDEAEAAYEISYKRLAALSQPEQAVDENGCLTAPNGDCISTGPCIHSVRPEHAKVEPIPLCPHCGCRLLQNEAKCPDCGGETGIGPLPPPEQAKGGALKFGPALALSLPAGEPIPARGAPDDAVERAARGIALSQGQDPDEFAPLSVICTTDGKPAPWWMAFTEHAEAALAAAYPSGAPVPDGWKLMRLWAHETTIARMIAKAMSVSLSQDYTWPDYMRDLYAVALDAAPSSPNKQEGR